MFLSAFADEATLAQVQSLGALAYLVKPLDVGQIVPSVEAAFARLRSAGPAAAAPDVAATTAILEDPLPLAVGVLMHRHSLTRAEAWQRLQKLAQEHELPLATQAQRLLTAVEELARTGT